MPVDPSSWAPSDSSRLFRVCKDSYPELLAGVGSINAKLPSHDNTESSLGPAVESMKVSGKIRPRRAGRSRESGGRATLHTCARRWVREEVHGSHNYLPNSLMMAAALGQAILSYCGNIKW